MADLEYSKRSRGTIPATCQLCGVSFLARSYELKHGRAQCCSDACQRLYMMIYSAVQEQHGLIHGRLHDHGASCAIGSYFNINAKTGLPSDLIDEVAAVNDSVPHMTGKQRKAYVSRWLRWKLKGLWMPGFSTAKQP